MQFPTILLTLALAVSVAAKGDGNKTLSTAGECKQMRKLNALVSLAGNSTKLDAVTKGNTTKADAIKAKASAATPQLDSLMSNTTLMSACAVINAAAMDEAMCQETFALQRFVAFAANTTAVSALTKDNATKAAAIQAKASTASTKLAALTSNTTLQAGCPAVMQKDQCKFMNGLMKFVATANNQTKLDKLTKGNTTKAGKVKAEAAMAQTKLDAMMSNTTFVDACKSLKTTQEGTTGNTNSAAGGIKSSAVKNVEGGMGAILSAVAVVVVGMFML